MTVGAAGVGFTAVDLIPPRFEISIRERVPGAKVDVDDYKKVGLVLGVVLDEEDWHSYDTEFDDLLLSGVIYAGAITGYVGIVGKRGWFGPGSTKAPTVNQACKEIVEHFIEKVGYEKDIKDLVWPSGASDDGMFNVAASMVRTRPFDPEEIKLENIVAELAAHIKAWGKQFSEHMVHALPHVFGHMHYKPVGMMCVSAGFRFWAVGGGGKYSSKKKRVAEDQPNIKEGFKQVLRSIKKYRCWEKVWWKGEWIG